MLFRLDTMTTALDDEQPETLLSIRHYLRKFKAADGTLFSLPFFLRLCVLSSVQWRGVEWRLRAWLWLWLWLCVHLHCRVGAAV